MKKMKLIIFIDLLVVALTSIINMLYGLWPTSLVFIKFLFVEFVFNGNIACISACVIVFALLIISAIFVLKNNNALLKIVLIILTLDCIYGVYIMIINVSGYIRWSIILSIIFKILSASLIIGYVKLSSAGREARNTRT